MPELFIIAGCNGAGKTTAAYNLLPEVFQTIDFVNADEIARGINAADVNAAAFSAGKIMLQKLDSLIESQVSFAFETTLSGTAYLKFIERAKRHGFVVTLFFIYLEDDFLAKERVALRVSKGGHNIPSEIIERRYFKGIKNFKKYADAVDDWYLFDNSTSEYLLIAKSIFSEMEILNFDVFNKITGL